MLLALEVALFSIFLKTYFKCFFLVFLFFVVLPTLTTLDLMVQGKEETDNPVKGEPNKQGSVLGQGRGQDVIMHRHLGTSALGKTKNTLATAGQHSTLNATVAVTKGFRNEKREH